MKRRSDAAPSPERTTSKPMIEEGRSAAERSIRKRYLQALALLAGGLLALVWLPSRQGLRGSPTAAAVDVGSLLAGALNASSAPFTQEAAAAINGQLQGLTADEVLRWVAQALPGRVVQFSSFGPTGLVILDRLDKLQLLSHIPVVTIDTLHLFQETHELVRNISRHYPEMKLHTYYPDGFTEGQTFKFDVLHGDDLWTHDFQQYSYLTKVEPTLRALKELDPAAWITGRRRSQGGERQSLPIVEVDSGRLKINPLADWTRDQVWDYIHSHGLSYNPLHDRGYSSIGDSMNTRPVEKGESERDGRFMYSGTNRTTECGMHTHAAKMEAFKREAEAKHEPMKVPQLPCTNCVDVTPDTFDTLVMRASRNFVIEFYSPICGHCRAFAPEYDKVAHRLEQEGVPAFRMDVFSHTIPRAGKDAGFELSAYPTIFFAHVDPTAPPLGAHRLSVTRYEGPKEAQPLLDWLGEKLGRALGDLAAAAGPSGEDRP